MPYIPATHPATRLPCCAEYFQYPAWYTHAHSRHSFRNSTNPKDKYLVTASPIHEVVAFILDIPSLAISPPPPCRTAVIIQLLPLTLRVLRLRRLDSDRIS